MNQQKNGPKYHCICQEKLIEHSELLDHMRLEYNHNIIPIESDFERKISEDQIEGKISLIKSYKDRLFRETLGLISKIINRALKTNADLRRLEFDYEMLMNQEEDKEGFKKNVLALNKIDKSKLNEHLKEYFDQYEIFK